MAAPKHTPTGEQSAIIRKAKTSENFDVEAGAGCAKTTTLQFIAYDRPTVPMAYQCFNRSIADEAIREGKFAGTRTTPMTMHSLIARAVRREIGDFDMKNFTTKDIAGHDVFARKRFRKPRGWSDYMIAATVKQCLANYCSSDSPEVTSDHARFAIMVYSGDPDFLKSAGKRAAAEQILDMLTDDIADCAQRIFDISIDNRIMGHDFYLKHAQMTPSIIRAAYSGFREILLDEAQDSSDVQLSIISQSGRRLIRVGDRKQSIYAWRGAVDALARPNGDVLRLSVSQRFAQNVADIAMQVADLNPQGGLGFELIGGSDGKAKNPTLPTWGIISRTNMGVMLNALKLSRKGVAFNVDRRDDVLQEVRSARAMFETNKKPLTGPLAAFDTWEEVVREADEGKNGEIARMVKIIESAMDHELINAVSNSVESGYVKNHLITAHRAKGSQYSGVRIGDDFKSLVEVAEEMRKEEVSDRERITLAQEFNLGYVAVTRAEVTVNGHENLLRPPEKEPEPEIKSVSRSEAREVVRNMRPRNDDGGNSDIQFEF